MSRRGSQYIRSHVWGLIAVFIALTGTAVATGDGDGQATKSANPTKQVKKLKGKLASVEKRLAALEGKPGPTIPTSLPPNGPAGGSLAGSYPNPLLASNSVGSSELAGTVNSLNVGGPGTFPETLNFTGVQLSDLGIIIREDSNIVTQIKPDQQDIFGHGVVVEGRLFLDDFTAIPERADPGTPPANQAYLYVRESAGGFSELVIEWNDSTDVIAIEAVAG